MNGVPVTYAGDLTPRESYQLLETEVAATLVDVRTEAEWAFVGLPDLRELKRKVITIEWTSFPDGAANQSFLAELAAANLNQGDPVLFMCRSGARSQAAATAAAAAGYTKAYNVSDGFEGPLDEMGHRGSKAGWKADGLPWRQL